MKRNGRKKWTLMFFFASDNNLSPSMLAQIKSLKSAGFQLETNVLVHFDPQERGVPSRIFAINDAEKIGQSVSRIGDEQDPIVRSLALDVVESELTQEEWSTSGRSDSPADDRQDATNALRRFLDHSRNYYPADQYMLFLSGHGLVVGRDAFLPDDNPHSGISLVDLGDILHDFSRDIGPDVLELVGMHSCSMSAVEVAYELKGKANYMLASEGVSFVGAWPYRQMLQKIFLAVDKADGGTEELLKELHDLCLQNSSDFLLAGYSGDLCLCSLDPKRVEELTVPIEALTRALRAGLDDDRCRELILLAHLKSQSYFQEAYTDLYDFCLCLSRTCAQSSEIQNAMQIACNLVMDKLSPEGGMQGNGPVLRAGCFGPDCQYSYGLSIYFPWSRPVEDANEHFIENYKSYVFAREFCRASWLGFLESYFKKTMRPAREIQRVPDPVASSRTPRRISGSNYRQIGSPSSSFEYSNSSALTGKVSPPDSSGYPTDSYVKNYARNFSTMDGR